MADRYLVALVLTGDVPRDTYSSGAIVLSGQVREHVDGLLEGWGILGPALVNAQMREEARTAGWQIGRWNGEPMRLCGYLTRIDIYPVQPGDHGKLPLDLPDRAWGELAARYDRAAQRRQAHRILDGIGVPDGDPDRAGLVSWLCDRDPVIGEDYLRKYSALAARREVMARIPAYRHWQWVLAAARSGEHPGVYARELLAEIADGAAR